MAQGPRLPENTPANTVKNVQPPGTRNIGPTFGGGGNSKSGKGTQKSK